MRMWGGRFGVAPDPEFMEFTSSMRFDVRLYPYDIRCTAAWTGALARAGLIPGAEAAAVGAALEGIKEELDSGSFEFAPTDEDIHTAVERALVEAVGERGGSVRTGRSRNDQVATDMRLFVMDDCRRLVARVRALQGALLEKARETVDLPVPGHTHLQHAQPVLLAHLLLAFVQMMERDARRIEGARRSADVMPLGSGAMAGTPFDIDREALAADLGFSRVSDNSVDAVGDRDFVCDLLYALSMTMVHLSRLAEQLILWCSQEFDLVELDDAWATGSSLMPQKKNPDGPELVRGKSGRVTGALVSMLIVLKGTPLAYNRDLQEDKEQMFDAVDTAAGSLALMERTVATMTIKRGGVEELLGAGFLTATDLADSLVLGGLDFPAAHEVAGKVVAYCVDEGKSLDELSPEELARFCDLLDEGVVRSTSIEASIARRKARGGTAPEEVRARIDDAERMISSEPDPV